MIRFYEGEDGKILVSIAGENFSQLLHVCKDHGGKFNNTAYDRDGDPVFKVWEFESIVGPSLADAFLKIEPDSFIPDYVLDAAPESDTDFKKFRANINPQFVKGTFRGDYQRRAILKGISQNRLALFHEMGLGKSFEIQTILNHLVGWDKVDRYVIVSPPEGIINITRECLKFNTFGLTWDDVYIVDTEHRNPFAEEFLDKKVIVMTYRNLIMLHDDFYFKAQKKKASSRVMKNYIPWEKLGNKLALILDESPAIKNHTGKTFKIVDKSKKFFDYRYILTGTPAPKYAEDLWAQFRFLQQSCVPTEFLTFLKMIANIGNRYSQTAVNYYYEDKVQNFLDGVSYLVDRETVKSSGIKLPELLVEPVYCRMSSPQQTLYQNIVTKVVSVIREEQGKITKRALRNKYSYMALALHDPTVIKEGRLDEEYSSAELVANLKNWKITDNGKFEVAKSIVEKNVSEGKKTILWSGHPAIIDALAKEFEKYHPYKLHAGVVVNKGESVAQRNDAVVEAFKQNKESWLLIANYACLKTSVNIVEAPRQIYWDRVWDAEVFAQSLKRSHRIGQTEKVIVNPLIFIGSLEEEQDAELNKRLDFNSKVWMEKIAPEDKEDLDAPLSLEECKEILAGKKIA